MRLKKQRTVRLDDKEWAQIKRHAAEHEMSVSEWVHTASVTAVAAERIADGKRGGVHILGRMGE